MSNINVRKDDQRELSRASVTPEWEPARFIRQFFGMDPFRSVDPFREMMPMLKPDAGFMPAFEVKETKDGYTFKADVPGVKEGDVEITVTGKVLRVSGKRDAEKQERTDTYFTYERSYGSFSRAFTLPDAADTKQVHADLRDGVLSIIVGRRKEAEPQKIPVKGNVPKA